MAMDMTRTFSVGWDGDVTGEHLKLNAISVNDEISVLLLQNGIDPKTVNKLCIPSGFENVGTMTILAYIPNDLDWVEAERKLYAYVGPTKWRLSNNYSIKRLFPMRISPDADNFHSLAVITFDDWRYDINYTSSASTSIKFRGNSYDEAWRVVKSEGWEGEFTEDDGEYPWQVGRWDLEQLHLHYDDAPAFFDPWNAMGYNIDFSDASLAEKTLRSCGYTAVPRLLIREGFDEPPWEYEDITDEYWMVAEYIGNGHKHSMELWDHYKNLYMNGNINFCWGEVEDVSGEHGVHDEMIWGSDWVYPVPATHPEDWWISGNLDGKQGIPKDLKIKFPAKDMTTGKIIMYFIDGMTHGKPIDYANNSYVDTRQITDHIKTRAEIEEEDFVYAPSGITEYEIKLDGDWDFVVGLTAERVEKLVERALELSRTFYARYYAGTGDWSIRGFHYMHPFGGMQNLEYGFSRGVPYTRVHGTVDDERMGFAPTEFGKNTLMAVGGLMTSSRPDGMADLILPAAGSKAVYAVEVRQVWMADNCIPFYELIVLFNGSIMGWFANVGPIPYVCREPAEIGDVGILVTGKTFNFDDNETWYDASLFMQEWLHVRGCG